MSYNMALETLKLFHQFENGEIVKLMNDTSHHDGINYISENHTEGSVWAHTMMCLNYFLTTNKKVYYNDDVFIAIVISILCHDIGKVYTREVKDSGKVTFHNHPANSIFKTIDFMYFIRNAGIISNFDYTINLVLPAVSNHINLYNDSKNKHLYFNNNQDLYEVSLQLGMSDSMGSLSKNRKFKLVDYKEKDKKKEYDRTCYVFCGLPGVGKDYLAAKKGLLILSFDDERLDIYKNSSHYVDGLSELETYRKAHEYCDERKINLLKLIARRAKGWVGNIAVCNKNLSAKARRSIINSFGNYNFECIYVVSDMDTIIDRNNKRKSKSIGKDIILNTAMKQTIPSIREGFDTINIVAN